MTDEILKAGELVGPGKRLIMVSDHLGYLAEEPDLSSGYLSDTKNRDKEKNNQFHKRR